MVGSLIASMLRVSTTLIFCAPAGSCRVLAQNASFEANMIAGSGFMALAALLFGNRQTANGTR